MNLAEIKTVSYTHDVTHPKTGKKVGIKLEVISLNDDGMIAVKRKIGDKLLAKNQRSKLITTAESDANLRELIGRSIIGWEWGVDEDGEQAVWNDEGPLEYSAANVIKVLTALPWLQQQVNEVIESEANFFHGD